MYYAGKIAPALLVLGLVAGCTEQAKRSAPQPAPEPPPAAPAPDPTRELRAERGSLRVGMGPARHRLMLDAVVDAGKPAAPPPPAEPAGFLGKPERAVLEELRNGKVASVTKGSGGRTSAFNITFDSGAQAHFKPEQKGTNWYADVVAYYLDRALALGRVPPVVARSLPLGDGGGQVRGALIQTLGDKTVPVVTPSGWENWLRAESRPHAQPATPEPSRADLPAELSDTIVFDFLTLNASRFGRKNASLFTLGVGGPLILLDNRDAFSKGPARRGALDALAKFRRRTIDAVRALDVQALGQTLTADPLGPFLDTNMLRDLETRRKAVLEHVAKQERRYGDTVYAW